MTLPTLCIERPVMTTLLTMAIVAVGSVGYFFLPVAALPQVDFPTIAVSTYSSTSIEASMPRLRIFKLRSGMPHASSRPR